MELAAKAAKFLRLASRTRASLPTEIQVEVTNRCNLTCPMCPHTFGGLPISDMPLKRFGRILDQVPFATDIILTGWGEPLYHADFLGLMDLCRAKRPQARIRFTTNGYLLNEERARQVLDRSVSRVAFSFDEVPPEGGAATSGTPETPGHLPSRAAMANAERFCTMRKGTDCRVHYQVAMLDGNEAAILALIAHAARAGADAVALVRLETWSQPSIRRPDKARESEIIAKARAEGARRGVPVYCLNDHTWAMRVATHDDELCLKTDASVYITVDGGVTPCCNLRKLSAGNVEASTVAEIWQGEAFRRFFADQRTACGACDALQGRQIHAS